MYDPYIHSLKVTFNAIHNKNMTASTEQQYNEPLHEITFLFRGSDQVRHTPGSTTIKKWSDLNFLNLRRRGIVLFM